MPIAEARLFDRAPDRIHPGIVHQHVDPAEAREHRVAQRDDVGFLGHVRHLHGGVATGGQDFRFGLREVAAVRPHSATRAPNVASPCAMARPIPRPPPVTTATRPLRSNIPSRVTNALTSLPPAS